MFGNRGVFLFGILAIFLAFALPVNALRIDDSFRFFVEFEDEADNEYTIEGRIEDSEIEDLSVKFDIAKFKRGATGSDNIDQVDADIDSSSFDAVFDERDDEIRTSSNELTIDIRNERLRLRERIFFDVRAEDEDGQTETFDFSLFFNISDDEFEIEVEGLKDDLVDGSVRVVIDNESFDKSDRELEVRRRADDEVRIIVEGDFDVEFRFDRDFRDARGRVTAPGLTRREFFRATSAPISSAFAGPGASQFAGRSVLFVPSLPKFSSYYFSPTYPSGTGYGSGYFAPSTGLYNYNRAPLYGGVSAFSVPSRPFGFSSVYYR